MATHDNGVMIPRVVITVGGTIVAAAILGLFSFVLSVSNTISEVNARLITVEREEIPPPEVRFRLNQHETILDRHDDRLTRLEQGN